MLKIAATTLAALGVLAVVTRTTPDDLVPAGEKAALHRVFLDTQSSWPSHSNPPTVQSTWAWKITDRTKSLATQGPAAWGRTGDFAMRNEKIVVTIQGSRQGRGLFPTGGHIIDADVVGSQGHDRFREMFPVIDFRVPLTFRIAVIDDGSNGGASVIRVWGHDGNIGTVEFMDILGGKPKPLSYETDYILEPGQSWVRIRTRVTNHGDVTLSGIKVGDFLGMGASEGIFTDTGGFTPPVAFSKTRVLAHRSKHLAYAYVSPGELLTLPAGVQEPGTGALFSTPLVIAPAASATFQRFLVIAPTLATALNHVDTLNKKKLPLVHGYVENARREPVTNARVTIINTNKLPQKVMTETRTDTLGRYRFKVAPGRYDIVVTADGYSKLHRKNSTLPANADVSFTLTEQGPSAINVDFGGPIKVTALPHSTSQQMMAILGDYGPRVFYSGSGQDTFPLPPGQWQIFVSRGMEYELHQEYVDLHAADAVTVSGRLNRVISASRRGWLAMDLHQHTVGSPDGSPTTQQSVIQNLAEGCGAAVTSDHDRITDLRPLEVPEAHRFVAIPGIEVSPVPEGHINIFPVRPDYRKNGSHHWANASLSQLMTNYTQMNQRPFVMINHPRTPGMGVFQFLKSSPYEPQSPGPFDAIEVNGSLGQVRDYLPSSDSRIRHIATRGGSIPALLDWFGWLNTGRPIAGVGSSDSHKLRHGTCHPRTYVRVTRTGSTPSPAALVKALRGQQATVANGLFVTALINGQSVMGQKSAIRISNGRTLQMRVIVEAPGWVQSDTVTVFSNGRPVPFRRVGRRWREVTHAHKGATFLLPANREGNRRFDSRLELLPRHDSWYVVVATGSGSGEPVFQGRPFGFTNPVYVDKDGNGIAEFNAPTDTIAANAGDHDPKNSLSFANHHH